MSHLISLGHRRIGIIRVGPTDELPFYDRQRGYELAFKQHGIPLDERLIEVGPVSEAFGREAMLRLIDAPERPTAVFAFTDIVAIGAMKGARERGEGIGHSRRYKRRMLHTRRKG